MLTAFQKWYKTHKKQESARHKNYYKTHKQERLIYNIAWHRNHPWYKSWQHAKARCQNANDSAYQYYGKRGIKFFMAPEDFKLLWFKYKASKMRKPSIDRINNNDHYKLSNCRFIEFSENSKKARVEAIRRDNHAI